MEIRVVKNEAGKCSLVIKNELHAEFDLLSNVMKEMMALNVKFDSEHDHNYDCHKIIIPLSKEDE